MNLTIEAVFDGKTFQPTEPVTLAPDTPVRITILTQNGGKQQSFLDVARSLNLDRYLYGDREGDDH